MSKDLFVCKICHYEEMKENPLDTESCPNCESKLWDKEETECLKCNYSWIPRGISKECPNCRTPLHWFNKGEWKYGRE